MLSEKRKETRARLSALRKEDTKTPRKRKRKSDSDRSERFGKKLSSSINSFALLPCLAWCVLLVLVLRYLIVLCCVVFVIQNLDMKRTALQLFLLGTIAFCGAEGVTPITTDNIHYAVDEWIRNPVTAEVKYGSISSQCDCNGLCVS